MNMYQLYHHNFCLIGMKLEPNYVQKTPLLNDKPKGPDMCPYRILSNVSLHQTCPFSFS